MPNSKEINEIAIEEFLEMIREKLVEKRRLLHYTVNYDSEGYIDGWSGYSE